MKLTEKDRTYTVDSVDYSTGKVSLRDNTFAGSTGFPIFRSEPIAAVREWVQGNTGAGSNFPCYGSTGTGTV